MGVPGLWDVLRPTGQARALAHLAVEDGFVANANGYRAYRIGIDASIWFFHALGGKEGENPELRTLFFRCARLLAMPYLPIFVFDGPGRPKIKRGKAVGGKEHWLVNSLRIVLDAFGFECRTAPGEAEAELAFLNRVGAIDAVLSDDVDCFIFGAQTVMRNGSVTLSGNRAHATGDAQRVYIYRAKDIADHSDVGLSQGGLVLIALLRGGDYDGTGIAGCGVSTAHAVARAGFGDTLLAAARAGPAALAALLPTWRADLREELRTNASGFGPRKCPSVAQRITDTFPSLEVLRCYTHPLTSERAAGDLAAYGLGELWKQHVDVGKIAHVCERFFEWGFEEAVVKRFRTVIWPGAVLRTLLQAALERDGRTVDSHGGAVETPSKALARTLGGMALNRFDSDDDESSDDGYGSRLDVAALIKTIHSTRRHVSTDHVLEYRVEVRSRGLVARTRAGMQGLRVVTQDSARDPGAEDGDGDDEDAEVGKSAPDPDSTLRVWMPASVVEYACPRLVKKFEAKEAKKEAKKRAKGTGRSGKKKAAKALEEEERSDSVSPVKTKNKVLCKSKITTKKPGSPQEEDSDSGKLNKRVTKPAVTKAGRTRGGKKGEGDASGLRLPKTKNLFVQSPSKSVSSKSPLELLDNDPFLVSADLSPTHTRAGSGRVSVVSTPAKPRPFPLLIEADAEAEPDPFTSGPSRPPPHGRRHYLSSSAASSDQDTTSTRLKKSPRKSAGHTSPRKAPMQKPAPARAPSPSPMRPLQRARMKPLHMARSAVARMHEDVIVISSDSDDPAPPLKARPHRGGALAPSNSLNLDHDADIIDLT